MNSTKKWSPAVLLRALDSWIRDNIFYESYWTKRLGGRGVLNTEGSGPGVIPDRTVCTDPRRMKIGLVLSGGGGKGAYEIGCWRALRRLGLANFHVLSGTSVGALNAALVAMGDLDTAVRVWTELEESHVIEARAGRRMILVGLLIIAVMGRMLAHYAWLTALVAMALFIIPIEFALQHMVISDLPVAPTLSSILRLFSFPWWVWIVLLPVEVFAFLVCVRLLTYEPPVTLVLRDYLLKITLWLGKRTAVGSNAPLLNLLRRYVTIEKLRASGSRVYATIAIVGEWYNPFVPRSFIWIPDHNQLWDFSHPTQTTWFESAGSYVPGPFRGWSAETVELTSLETDDDMCTVLLQSANLPFVFPRGSWLGKATMDGGVFDNTPILPTVEADCDVIIVVHLDREGIFTTEDALNDVRAGMTAAYQRSVCQRLSRDDAITHYRMACQSGIWGYPRPSVPLSIDNVVCIVPSRGLGAATNFMGGRRALALIDLGSEDTIAALRRHPLLADYVKTVERRYDGTSHL